MKERDCAIYVAKTKALISFAVTAKLICVFVFAYAKSRFSHDAAQIMTVRHQVNAPKATDGVLLISRPTLFIKFFILVISEGICLVDWKPLQMFAGSYGGIM